MAGTYETRHVMNTILQRSFREGRPDMSPMKAQKMLFYTHGWHLATTGVAAIADPFEVWQYGPVVDRIYKDLKKFGGRSISSYIKDEAGNAYVVNSDCADIYESIDIAWEKYIGIGAVNLSAMTHEPGSPWDVARQGGQPLISNDLIRDYFVRQARR